jgi:hypothetical protein
MTQGIDPDLLSARWCTPVTRLLRRRSRGALDAGADYNRNRNAMIESGFDRGSSRIIWQSALCRMRESPCRQQRAGSDNPFVIARKKDSTVSVTR